LPAARDDPPEGCTSRGVAARRCLGAGRMRRALNESFLGPPRGLWGLVRERLGAQALAAVVDGQRAIEVGVDLDAGSGVAASTGPRPDLEEAPIELHRVIVLDGTLVLEAADAVEVCRSRCGAPRGVTVGRCLREAGIVAGEKPVEHALGLRERARLGETELDDEAILEGPKEPLDPTLGLRGMRTDPADAEFLEGAADLGRFGPALKLLGQGERGAGIAVEDPMAVGVGGAGHAIAAEELAEEQEVAVRVLFQAEDAAEDPARRVVDGGVEHQARAALFEPGVVAAVHLDKEAGLGHALTAATMAWGTAGAGTADPGGAQQPLHSLAGDPEAFARREQLGEVVIIHARIGGAGQGEDAVPDGLCKAPG